MSESIANKKNNLIPSENVENIYALSPMQEGMLFQYVSSRPDDITKNIAQICYRLSGEVVPEHLVASWQYVVKNNELLRSVFRWKRITHPVQVVLYDHPVNVEIEYFECDLKDSTRDIALLIDKERHRTFDLSCESFRVKLIKYRNDLWFMIVTSYNIIYDGWSNSIMISELLYAYECLQSGTEPQIKRKESFKQYLHWLKKNDSQAEKKFWSNYLGNINNCGVSLTTSSRNGGVRCESHTCLLADEVLSRIQRYTSELHVTIASLLYFAWGLVFYEYAGYNEALFGVTISGRPSDVDGIDDMVGLFINTLPFRAEYLALDSIQDSLGKAHANLLEIMTYQNTSLPQIKGYTGNSKRKLFESIVVVQNYPMETVLKNANKCFQMEIEKVFDQTEFPITLGITLYDGLKMMYLYDSECFSSKEIHLIASRYNDIIMRILDSDKSSLISDIFSIKKLKMTQSKLNELKEVNFNEIF